MSNQTFQTLKELPIRLDHAQCVIHKHELLICGGWDKRDCYSYHKIKNEYKLICKYPSDVELWGHCVVKLVDNNNKDSNQITILSFGGDIYKHTLVMKYISVWSNLSDISNKSNEFNNYNQWIPFKDNHNNPIIIGRDDDNYHGMRAVIGGSNNNLLFITYHPENISVFDLNTFQFIKHDILPTDHLILYHCFVSKSENEQRQQNYQMLLFCKKTAISIKYDEGNNTFQFHKLPVCKDIALFSNCAYVCIGDVILFFGGWNIDNGVVSKSVYKYSFQENKWKTFQNTLPSPLRDCIAMLSEEDNDIHIIGGEDDKETILSTHIKTKMRVWDVSKLSKKEIKFIIQHWVRTLKIKLGWIDDFDEIIMKYETKLNMILFLGLFRDHEI
ncbi:hypothetical protein RFI_07506 [Reticulomyxa filosa]|uniref:Kelch motif family protein n=1 Tax=Reticulomyxa filosa TaxID=46433 RepID=X6NWF8_RETFI|nr:hypothetical protein RFI_07506 [Reticulomyxa filosa]|eukprot:ETO29612.1 hypothetical protein RFI_07506 [Reticulomyxa filosa]